MRPVELVLALFDGGLVLGDGLLQRRRVGADGRREFGRRGAREHDARLFPVRVLHALFLLGVGEAQVGDVVGLRQHVRRKFGIPAVLAHEAVAFLVHDDAAVVGHALLQRLTVVHAVERVALVGAHVLQFSAQFLRPQDAFARGTRRHHLERVDGFGAVLGKHVGIVGEPAGGQHGVLRHDGQLVATALAVRADDRLPVVVQHQAHHLAFQHLGDVGVGAHAGDERVGEAFARVVGGMHAMGGLPIVQRRIDGPHSAVGLGPFHDVLRLLGDGVHQVGTHAVVAGAHDVHHARADAVGFAHFFLLLGAHGRDLAAGQHGSAAKHARLLAEHHLRALLGGAQRRAQARSAAADDQHVGLGL